jgi:hypothetical protein
VQKKSLQEKFYDMLQSKIKQNHEDTMIGKQERKQRHLFKAGNIDQFIPKDQLLRRIINELNWLLEAE